MLGTATCVFLGQKVLFAEVKVLKNIAQIVNAAQVSQCQYDLRFSCDRNVNILRKVHNQPFPLLPFCIKGFLVLISVVSMILSLSLKLSFDRLDHSSTSL